MSIGSEARFSFDSHKKAVRDVTRAMKELAASAMLTKEQLDELGILFNPRAELLERLNIRLKGGDPGEPFNWRGERGM